MNTERMVRFLRSSLDAYLDDLQSLVSIDCGTEHKEGVDAVAAWLAERLASLGFQVERRPQVHAGDDVLAVRRGAGGAHILLLGHSDTVYPVGTAARRPMQVRGDKVLGPGTADMKGGLLNGIYALAALAEQGFDDFGILTYLCVSDEESGERHSIPLIRAQGRAADAALTLEAARENGDIVTARKGLRWYTVEAFGRAAHAGVEPEKGRSAILALARHIVALEGFNHRWPGVTVNTGYVLGGSLPSVVADYARMRIDLRAPDEQTMEALVRAVHRELEEPRTPGVRVVASLEADSVCPAMERTPAVAELERLATQSARELGFEIRGASTGGVSDAGYVAAEGTPVLDGLGPIGGLDHSPDEYIQLSSIVPRTALLAKLIVAISQREKERPE